MRSKLNLLLLTLAFGCGDGTGDGQYQSLEERPCPEDNFLTWENFGAPFLLEYCTGCHGADIPLGERQAAPVDVNFDTVEDVRGRAAQVWKRAADQNETMPPVGGPSAGERELLGEWLACGAPTADDAD